MVGSTFLLINLFPNDSHSEKNCVGDTFNQVHWGIMIIHVSTD